ERAAGLWDLEQVELRLPDGRARADAVIPDEVRDRVRELELLRLRIGRVEFRIADERVLVRGEHGQTVDAGIQGHPGNLEVRGRDEGASDRDADARRQLVESRPELVEGPRVQRLRVSESGAPRGSVGVAGAIVAAAGDPRQRSRHHAGLVDVRAAAENL